MKLAIIALSAVLLITAAPALLAQTPDQQHHTSKKHPRVVSGYAARHVMHAKGFMAGYPGAFGYAPSEPKDYSYENSRNAGGGGGGGGSGM